MPRTQSPNGSATYTKPASAEQNLKWVWIWFKQLAAFHRFSGGQPQDFTAEEVIAFLRSKRDSGTPAWKRMKGYRRFDFISTRGTNARRLRFAAAEGKTVAVVERPCSFRLSNAFRRTARRFRCASLLFVGMEEIKHPAPKCAS